MRVLRPTTITDALLTEASCTIAEPDTTTTPAEAAWNSGTTYGAAARVILVSTHRIYTSIQAGNLNHDPATDSALATPLWWTDTAPTNRWAVFDQSTSTASTATTTMTWAITPGIINSLALIDLVGTSAHVVMMDGATEKYNETFLLSTSSITDWYAYFFEPFTQKGLLIILDLPPYAAAETTITIAGTGTVQCGGIIPGTTTDLGGTQYGATAGIHDYSRKVTDADTGVITLEQRKFAKIMRAKLQIESGAVNAVHQILTNLRATPSVWIGDDDAAYEPLIVFGFYKDFSLEVAYPGSSYYSLEIEGMT